MNIAAVFLRLRGDGTFRPDLVASWYQIEPESGRVCSNFAKNVAIFTTALVREQAG